MSGRVAGKRALVTGSAQGLGAAITRRLAAAGAQVVASDINASGVADVANGLNAELGAGTVSWIRLDVTSEADWSAAINHCRAELGGLSVLVNNAGIITVGSVEELSLEAWRRAMAVNVDSAFLGIKHALPLMRDSQPASIVNIASISALVASHNLASYNASKAALAMLSKSVALHCARCGWDIRSNSILPTFVRTPLLRSLIGDRDEKGGLAKLARQVPLGRIGEVDDVADAVIYLASDESRMMTGADIKLDGGLSAM
jgi:NAD(P)-dependent dehydrogenase (short-subunit alcohol dehydrogenase family)